MELAPEYVVARRVLLDALDEPCLARLATSVA